MSLGWYLCSVCQEYKKLIEVWDYNTFSCGHKWSETACYSDLTPSYSKYDNNEWPDDIYYKDRDAGVIAEYEKAWKQYQSSKSEVEVCSCGKVHFLGVTFKV